MNIRLANTSDLPSVIKILHKVVPLMHKQGNFQWDVNYPTVEEFTHDLNNRHLYVAVDKGVVLGCVVINAAFANEYFSLTWKTSPNTFTFHRMMVDPSHAREGIGKALFAYIEQRGMWMGMRSVRVDTSEDNKAMLNLFEKFKYQFVGNIQLRGQVGSFKCFEKTLQLSHYV